MIAEVIAFAKTQPILIGGVGTVLVSSSVYLARSIPKKIFSFARHSLISTFSIDNSNDYYNSINRLVFDSKLSWTFRNYEPAETEYEAPFDDEKKENQYLIPGYGSGWGLWKGILFSFYKEREDHGQRPVKKLFINFYTRKEELILAFFREAIELSEGKSIQKLYLNDGHHWYRSSDKKLRSLDTLFLNGHVKDTVVEKLNIFLKSEKEYSQRGIPYKFCMLFYGIPGTGKTSFIHAIASHFKLDIYYVEKLGKLQTLFSRKMQNGIVVIEDIDALSRNLNRGKEDQSDDPTNTFHDLLNSLDGFMSQHGLIVAITSNHPEKLDEALVRPGRIDISLEIGPLDLNAAKEMFFAFYGHTQESISDWNMIEVVYQPTVGSQLQEIFLNNSSNGAFNAICSLYTTKIEPLQMAAGG